MQDKPKKKPTKKKLQKAVISQSNRFVYAKYNMNTNEMKFFMWIVGQLNSMNDNVFKECVIPLSEIMEVWQRKNKEADYSYIKALCNSMLKKTYVEDFKVIDAETQKAKGVFEGFTLFKTIKYIEGQGYITYQLNDCLIEHFLKLNGKFTQLNFTDIQQMKSAYSIRIYNMLLCEIKQLRKTLKINLEVLQNTLEVPKTLFVWKDFNINVLKQATKDINNKSNLFIADIKTFKTGKKITEIEFHFDYKTHEESQSVEKTKQNLTNKKLSKYLNLLIGRTFNIKDYGEITLMRYDINSANFIEATFKNQENKKVIIPIKSLRDIKALEKQDLSGKNRAVILQFQREIKKNVNRAKEISKNVNVSLSENEQADKPNKKRENLDSEASQIQSGSKKEATLFDKLNVSDDTKRIFKRAIIPNKKQS